MKIQVLSDIHLEHEGYEVNHSSSDVVILAGDIHVKDKGVLWAIENIKNKPVIYVLGNHEFYGKAYPRLLNSLKELCKGTNVHVLEKEMITIDGVNFLGCTLWTDFNLFGDPRITGYQCQQIMSDYRKIRVSPRFSKLRALDVSSIHNQSLTWLKSELIALEGETNVVVTHHAPSIKSLPDGYESDVCSAAYASHLDDFIKDLNPMLWVHGHLHNSSDYMIGDTRVVCNSRGYPDERNPSFSDRFIINLNKTSLINNEIQR